MSSGMVGSAQTDVLHQFLHTQFDVLQTVKDNIDVIRAVANQLTPIADLEDFRNQVGALHEVLALLSDASGLILAASTAGIILLTAEDAAAQRAALGLGSASLAAADDFAAASVIPGITAAINNLQTIVDGLVLQMAGKASQAIVDALVLRVVDLETPDTQNLLSLLAGRIAAMEAQDFALLISTLGNRVTLLENDPTYFNLFSGLNSRVLALEADQTDLDLINALILQLQNGFYNTALTARVTALEAALAALAALVGTGAGTPYNDAALLARIVLLETAVAALGSNNYDGQFSAIGTQLALLNALNITLDQRITAGALGTTTLTTRIVQVENDNEALALITTEVTARIGNAEGTLLAQASASNMLSARTTLNEDNITAEATARTALAVQLTNTITGVTANATAVQQLQTTVQQIGGETQASSAALITLDSRVDSVETGITGQATATSLLNTRVTSSENGIEAIASDITELVASIASVGNLLPNSGFEVNIAGWTIFSPGPGWATAELVRDLDPGSLPASIHTIAVAPGNFPTGSLGVRTSDRVPVVARKTYIASTYLAVTGARTAMYWRLFDTGGVEVGYGLVGETTAGPATNLDDSVRVHAFIPIPVGASELQLQWWVTDVTANAPKAWMFRPMLEQAVGAQALPSPWAPGINGIEAAVATAVESLTARVEVAEGIVDVQSASVTTLTALVSVAAKTYYQASEPTGGVYGNGDLWFDSDNANKQYVWTGGLWVPATSETLGLSTFAQDEAPVGSFTAGDLWIDTNDNNKLYRWNGTTWVPLPDGRITATADAVDALTTRVTSTENSLTTASTSITNLGSRIDNQDGVIAGQAGAITTLNSDVALVKGSKAAVFTQPSQPTTVGRTNGDIWIDTDDGNRMYVWDGAWSVRDNSNAGLKVFAQASEPSTVGRVEGDLWFDTDDNNKQYRWNGVAWLNISDSRIVSQAAQITSLQAQVGQLPDVYVQITQPTGGTYNVGDIWFDSDDSNKQYIWNGSIWATTSAISGSVSYAQTTEPTGGSYNVGDLWIDTDDGNRLYRWNGGNWIDLADTRIAGNATAVTGLTTRVSAAEGTILSQAGLITTLQSTMTTKTKVFVQAAQPTGTVVGDVWIDTDDGNKTYTWNGSTWDIRILDAGARTFAQPGEPAAPRFGDLWVDTDNNNRLYRWNGGAWDDLTDGRIAGQATAITNLQTSVGNIEGVNTAQAGLLTSLDTRVTNAQSGVDSQAGALTTLTTRVTNTENVNTAQAGSLTTLSSRIDDGADLVLIARNGAVVSGHTLSRPAGSGNGWNVDVYSKDSYTGGAFASASPATNSSSLMFGLNTDPVLDTSYATIDYAFYCSGDTTLQVYESGNYVHYVGTYSAGDFLSIQYDGTAVKYYHNGVVVRTLPVAATDLTLSFDSSLFNETATLRNVQFGPFSALGEVKAGITANATATTALDTRVGNVEGVNTAQAGAITTLQTTMNSATSTAVNSLNTRVDNVEGVNTSQATSITALNTSVAGKADVSALTTLTTRVADVEGAGGKGANLLTNSTFNANLKGWFTEGTTSGSMTRDLHGFAWQPAGMHALVLAIPGLGATINSDYYYAAQNIPVQGDKTYFGSAYMAAHRGNAFVYVEYRDQNGTFLGAHITGNISVPAAGQNLASSFTRIPLKSTAPPNATTAKVCFGWRKSTNDATEPYLWIIRPMWEETTAAQLAPSTWNASGFEAMASYDLKLDVNNYITGWTFKNDGTTGDFTILADKFSIVAPAGGARYEYSSGNVRVYDSAGTLRVRLGIW